VLGIFETTTMRVISSAVIMPKKMSKSRIISAIVDSIAGLQQAFRSTLSKLLSIKRVDPEMKAKFKVRFIPNTLWAQFAAPPATTEDLGGGTEMPDEQGAGNAKSTMMVY
jgi:hypothetical protein